MPNTTSTPNPVPEKKQDNDGVQIEPLSDKSLEDAAGGCPVASCSANVCSGVADA
jgi:hypothetical protein